MAEATHRHGLPLLQAGQAQKELTHNEALALLDLLAHPAVEAVLASPPADPQPGQMWIVGADATGEWAGQDGALTCYTSGGWRFARARAGLLAWHKAAGVFTWFDGANWRTDGWPTAGILVGGQSVVGARRGAISAPNGGGTIDAQARAAIGQILSALQAHGLIEI